MSTKDLSKESFDTSRKFYDDKNYPRGMSRSGEYSISEVQLLEKYGVALSGISNGEITPVTNEEKQFKNVCQGKQEAKTSIEKAWMKYQHKVLSPKHFHTLFGRSKVEAANTATDDPTEGNIDLDDD